MDAEALDRFILDTVEAEPDPPRFVDRGALLVHCTLNAPSAAMIAAGVITLTLVGQFSFTGRLGPGQESPITAFHLVMGSFGLGLALLPFLTFARMTAILRDGVLTTARIVSVHPAEAPEAPPSPPGARVVGTRVVAHPLGPFEEPFASDAEYAEALLPGIEMGVLVHPRRPKVLRDLRPVR